MKYFTYIILLVLGITILLFSFYVQIKHQEGYYKQEIPQELYQEIIKEYKEIRGIESTDTPTDSVQGTESEVEQSESASIEKQTRLYTESKKKTVKKAVASWYDRSACGEKEYGTDCFVADYPELFNEQALTVAHRSLEFGTIIKFSHNDTEVECRVNDRGPFVDGREFDLSLGCADALGITSKGVAKLTYEIR